MSYSATLAVQLGETGKPAQRFRRARQILILVLADATAFLCADALFRWGRRVPAVVFFPGKTPTTGVLKVDVFIGLAILFLGMRYLYGDYSHRTLFWDSARDTTRALIITSVPDLLFLVIAAKFFSTSAVIGSWIFLIAAVPLFRQLARIAMSKFGIWRVRTALVGDSRRMVEIYAALAPSLSLGYDLGVVISDHTAEALPSEFSRLEHISASDSREAIRRVLQSGCSQAVIAAEDTQSQKFSDIIQLCLEADIKIVIVPSLRRLPLVGLNSSYFFGKDILLLQVRNDLVHLPQRAVKRSFDIVGSMVLLILLAPVFAWIAIAIKYDDGGPVFFKQKRVGFRDREFFCVKFRTMLLDADARMRRWKDENPALYEEFWKTYKLRDDPRVTKIGKKLRSSSLDELPQLINVLRGDMSLVGPRPVPREQLVRHFEHTANMYSRVRPGMTGLWQVSGRSNIDMDRRIVYDELYVMNWSFWYDIVILLQTAWIVVTRKGAY